MLGQKALSEARRKKHSSGVLLAALIIFFTFIGSSEVRAQWIRVFQPLDRRYGDWGGVIRHNSNQVWVGNTALWRSFNRGVSWERSALPLFKDFQGVPDVVYDLAFSGDSTVLAGTFGASGKAGVYLSTDAGGTWKLLFGNGTVVGVAFGNNIREMICLEWSQAAYCSHDGGLSWQATGNALAPSWGIGVVVAMAASGSHYYLLNWEPPALRLYSSSDNGLKWKRHSGTIGNRDCYSISVDSCSPQSLSVVNENAPVHPDDVGSIFRTTDEGETWFPALEVSTGEFTGSFARCERAMYAPTGGPRAVLRSLDQGHTWRSIGGPSRRWDSRNITALSENELFAVDDDGDVWQTINSGGFPIPAGSSEPGFTFPALLDGTAASCDTTIQAVSVFRAPDCDELHVEKQWIEGDADDEFTIGNSLPDYITGSDTVRFTFHPTKSGSKRVVYHAIISGREYTILFSPEVRRFESIAGGAGPLTFSPGYLCGSSETKALVLTTKSCDTWSVVAADITGGDRDAFSVQENFPIPLSGIDTLHVAFTPQREGRSGATLILHFDDGSVDSARLSGSASGSWVDYALTLSTVRVNEVGGEAKIPLTLYSRGDALILFRLTYDTTSLLYSHVSGSDGAPITSVDGQGQITVGPVQLDSGQTTVILHFDYYPGLDSLSSVRITSASSVTPLSICEGSQGNTRTIVTSDVKCDSRLLSELLRYKIFRLDLYPNPASDVIAIQGNQDCEATLSVIDVNGKTLIEENISINAAHAERLSIASLPAGSYIVLVRGPFGQRRRPFLKLRP